MFRRYASFFLQNHNWAKTDSRCTSCADISSIRDDTMSICFLEHFRNHNYHKYAIYLSNSNKDRHKIWTKYHWLYIIFKYCAICNYTILDHSLIGHAEVSRLEARLLKIHWHLWGQISEICKLEFSKFNLSAFWFLELYLFWLFNVGSSKKRMPNNYRLIVLIRDSFRKSLGKAYLYAVSRNETCWAIEKICFSWIGDIRWLFRFHIYGDTEVVIHYSKISWYRMVQTNFRYSVVDYWIKSLDGLLFSFVDVRTRDFD